MARKGQLFTAKFDMDGFTHNFGLRGHSRLEVEEAIRTNQKAISPLTGQPYMPNVPYKLEPRDPKNGPPPRVTQAFTAFRKQAKTGETLSLPKPKHA